LVQDSLDFADERVGLMHFLLLEIGAGLAAIQFNADSAVLEHALHLLHLRLEGLHDLSRAIRAHEFLLDTLLVKLLDLLLCFFEDGFVFVGKEILNGLPALHDVMVDLVMRFPLLGELLRAIVFNKLQVFFSISFGLLAYLVPILGFSDGDATHLLLVSTSLVLVDSLLLLNDLAFLLFIPAQLNVKFDTISLS
jgi:hypothetical protein